jgi:hypothetical protein
MLGLNADFGAGSQRVKRIRRICDLHHEPPDKLKKLNAADQAERRRRAVCGAAAPAA